MNAREQCKGRLCKGVALPTGTPPEDGAARRNRAADGYNMLVVSWTLLFRPGAWKPVMQRARKRDGSCRTKRQAPAPVAQQHYAVCRRSDWCCSRPCGSRAAVIVCGDSPAPPRLAVALAGAPQDKAKAARSRHTRHRPVASQPFHIESSTSIDTTIRYRLLAPAAVHSALTCVCRYFPGIATPARRSADMGMPARACNASMHLLHAFVLLAFSFRRCMHVTCRACIPCLACFHALFAFGFRRSTHVRMQRVHVLHAFMLCSRSVLVDICMRI